MGRLVRVTRVLRFVVHFSGGRRAGFESSASSSSSSARAARLADAAQLALALGDGLGGEGQRQLEQVNLAPEGIYLGGRGGGGRGRSRWARGAGGGRGGGGGAEGQERMAGRRVEAGRAEAAVI